MVIHRPGFRRLHPGLWSRLHGRRPTGRRYRPPSPGVARVWYVSPLQGFSCGGKTTTVPKNTSQGDRPESARVVRGGAFNNIDDNVRCANRNRNNPDNRNRNNGFRFCVAHNLPVRRQCRATTVSRPRLKIGPDGSRPRLRFLRPGK
ncbi:MAG: SUMF1/EgtB/PvdO family nonheme iron enzyme [Desulfococcaceae bacterium]